MKYREKEIKGPGRAQPPLPSAEEQMGAPGAPRGLNTPRPRPAQAHWGPAHLCAHLCWPRPRPRPPPVNGGGSAPASRSAGDARPGLRRDRRSERRVEMRSGLLPALRGVRRAQGLLPTGTQGCFSPDRRHRQPRGTPRCSWHYLGMEIQMLAEQLRQQFLVLISPSSHAAARY
nr:uncharacterized protein LOC116808100 [Taeniopygia guttata]